MAFATCTDLFLEILPPGLLLAAPDLSHDPDGFYASYSSAGWRLRKVHDRLNADGYERLEQSGIPNPERLTPIELARAYLLCRGLTAAAPDLHLSSMRELFRTGDNAERETLLKVLVLMPAPERFLEIALDACRSAVQTTVEAITLDNAYPDRHFSPPAFRGMVLKALHLGLPLSRIHRLDAHRDDELARMAEAYASERRAAGRPVSDDIRFVTSGSL